MRKRKRGRQLVGARETGRRPSGGTGHQQLTANGQAVQSDGLRASPWEYVASPAAVAVSSRLGRLAQPQRRRRQPDTGVPCTREPPSRGVGGPADPTAGRIVRARAGQRLSAICLVGAAHCSHAARGRRGRTPFPFLTARARPSGCDDAMAASAPAREIVAQCGGSPNGGGEGVTFVRPTRTRRSSAAAVPQGGWVAPRIGTRRLVGEVAARSARTRHSRRKVKVARERRRRRGRAGSPAGSGCGSVRARASDQASARAARSFAVREPVTAA